MKKLLLGAAAIVALVAAGPAGAADLAPVPMYKAPPMVPLYSWTGCYIGANVGGSFGSADTGVVIGGVPVSTQTLRMDGVVGGGQAGCNYQTGTWVWGLEADIQGTSQDGSDTLSRPAFVTTAPVGSYPANTLTYGEKLPWLGTLRGRLGITPSDRWLLYATGGLAVGEVDTSSTFAAGAASVANNFSNTRLGWTVGAGVEAALWGNWTGKLEYLYVDLGSFGNTFTGIGAILTPVTINSHVTDNIVRGGLNYRFDWGGPVVARY